MRRDGQCERCEARVRDARLCDGCLREREARTQWVAQFVRRRPRQQQDPRP